MSHFIKLLYSICSFLSFMSYLSSVHLRSFKDFVCRNQSLWARVVRYFGSPPCTMLMGKSKRGSSLHTAHKGKYTRLITMMEVEINTNHLLNQFNKYRRNTSSCSLHFTCVVTTGDNETPLLPSCTCYFRSLLLCHRNSYCSVDKGPSCVSCSHWMKFPPSKYYTYPYRPGETGSRNSKDHSVFVSCSLVGNFYRRGKSKDLRHLNFSS